MLKKIPGFSRYYADTIGNIYSTKWNKVKKLKPRRKKNENRNKYLEVDLKKNKKTFYRRVHRLILETFIGKRPKGKECRHLNDNKIDNKIKNLRWGTRKENFQDRLSNFGKMNYY